MRSDAELALGIDTGGSGTRWCLAGRDGEIAGAGMAAPVTGHLFSEAARRHAETVVGALAEAVGEHGRPQRILAGITGLGPTLDEPAEFLRLLLASRFRLTGNDVRIVDDMWLTYRTLFAPGEGIVVSGGTGTFGYHLTAGGDVVRAGGYGIMVDDAGGGAWIGRRALRAILRKEDEAPGSGWATPLGAHVAARVGGASWDAVRPFVYGGDRGSLAALAAEAARAAAEGDALAASLFAEAGAELAGLGVALRRRVGGKPVALTGRAAFLDPRVAEAFSAAVAPPVQFHPSPDCAAAAARLAFAPA